MCEYVYMCKYLHAYLLIYSVFTICIFNIKNYGKIAEKFLGIAFKMKQYKIPFYVVCTLLDKTLFFLDGN